MHIIITSERIMRLRALEITNKQGQFWCISQMTKYGLMTDNVFLATCKLEHNLKYQTFIEL